MKRKGILSVLLLALLVGCGGNSISNKTSTNLNTPTQSTSVKNPISNQTGSSITNKESSSTLTSDKVSTITATVVENPDQRIYLIGAAVWGWSNYAELKFYSDNIYRGTFDLKTTTEGFVITSQTDFNGLVFKTKNDQNFTVDKYGTYDVMFTYDVTKTDSTWTKSKEKNNAAEAYYKIILKSFVEIPIDVEMMYVNGASVAGWGTYMPLFLDEETEIYSYIYGLSASLEGFVFTNAEDNTHAVYHHEDGSNIKAPVAGDYEVLFTYKDMSADSTWVLLKDQSEGADGYYKLVPQFEMPDLPDTPIPSSVLYIFGDSTGGWANVVALPEVETGVYSKILNLTNSVQGFVICQLPTLQDKSGFCLHNENGDNFVVAQAGEYELSVTWNDMSEDPAWKVAKEVNSNAKGDAYYKLVPQFEISDEPEEPKEVVIEKLYLNGGNVGGWESFIELTKVNDKLFQGRVALASSGDGFVVTAQKSRNATDVVFKLENENNLNITKAGNYNVTVSLEEQDSTWTKITDCKGNYKEPAYIKIEEIVETRVNATQNGKTTAEASSVTGSKTANLAIDGNLGDTKRWESVQGVDPQWIIIDLGEEVEINGIDIQWYGGASAKTYTIEVSTDKESWDLLKDVTNASTTRNRLDEHSFEARTVRYIKVYGSSRVGDYGYSIDELYVWKV